MFLDDEIDDDYIPAPTPSGLDTAETLELPQDLPEEELSQEQKDQAALEAYQRQLAKGLLYEAQEMYSGSAPSDRFLSVKGNLELMSAFTREAVPKAAAAIRQAKIDRETELLDSPDGRDGELLSALDKLTNNLDYEHIALIALSNILRGIQTGSRPVPPEHKITRSIGTELDFEAFIKYLGQLDPDLLRYVSTRNLTESNTRRNKRIKGTIATIDDFYDVDWTWLTDKQIMQVGGFLRQVIFDELGYFELLLCMGSNGHKQYAMVLSDLGVQRLNTIMSAVEQSVAKNFFMITPPRDWDDQGTGGGWSTAMPYPMNILIRNSMGTKASNAAIRAINGLQRTAWEINPFIYNLCTQLLYTNCEIGSFRAYNEELYSSVDCPLIIDPDDLEYSWDDINLTPEERKKRNNAYRISKLWEEEKNSRASKALSPRTVLKMAEFFLFHQFGPAHLQPPAPPNGDNSEEARIQRSYHNSYVPVPDDDAAPRHYDCFYSPWFMDNRTRCYPGVDTLNPQGSDFQKALMMFHRGTPVSEASRRDLLISIATTYGHGIDKQSLDARVKWAESIVSLMVSFVADPLEATSRSFWAEADEPFQFLALCHEYVNIFVHKIWTEHKVSAGRDATCSGIQITGAMLRDSRTCKLVNVLPSDKPQDAYSDVAKEARRLLKNDEWLMQAVEKREKNRKKRFELMHQEFRELLKQEKRKPEQAPPEYVRRDFEETKKTILENISFIDRSIAKMPTMLIPYGGSFLTIYGHVKDKLKKRDARFHTADYTIITSALIQGMGISLPAFSEVNKWFQSLAKAALAVPLGDGEQPSIRWETPAGSEVRQEYRKPKYTKVISYLGDTTRHYLNQSDDTKNLNESKMRTALAANVVHSIDASIIQTAVNSLLETHPDIQFTAVHDCIYGPSGSFSVLLDAIRRAFYECVKENITQHIAENNLPNEQYRELLPVLKRGRAQVTLQNLLKSEYLFS